MNWSAHTGSVRGVAEAAADIARRTVGAASWPEASEGTALLRSRFNVPSYGGHPIVREALMSAMLATLSGVDHALAWTRLLDDGSSAIAPSTVARGAIEGFASAFYLLRAEDPEQFVSRHLAVTRAGMRFPQRHSRFQDFTGAILDNSELPVVHETIAQELGLKLERPLIQDMVQTMLSAGLEPGTDASPEIYSQLSGAAHAVTSALGMYFDRAAVRLAPQAEILTEQAGYLFVATSVTTESWIEVFDADDEMRRTWRAARAAAERQLSKLISH